MAAGLQKLAPHHHVAIRMRIAGESHAAIEARLGVKRRTLYLWFGDPLVKDEIEAQMRNIRQVFVEKLVETGLIALDETQGLLRQPIVDAPLDARTKLEVIREVLDRNIYTARVADRQAAV